MGFQMKMKERKSELDVQTTILKMILMWVSYADLIDMIAVKTSILNYMAIKTYDWYK